MPVTRSQTHLSQHRPRSTLRGHGQGDSRPNRTPSSLALPIPGYAGFHYDTQRLSPVSAGRAAEGIDAGFVFHGLECMVDGQERYIAFQLYVPVAVRVYNPDVQRLPQNKVTCNCIDYQSTQSACAHLYWLFTRLNGVLGRDQQDNQQGSMQVEVISGLSALYPLIEQRRGSLPRDLSDELELDSDESIFEDTIEDGISHHNEPADAYELNLATAEIPRRGRYNRSL